MDLRQTNHSASCQCTWLHLRALSFKNHVLVTASMLVPFLEAPGHLRCSGFGCSRQQKHHAAAPPPAGVWRRMERKRQKLVGRDKGSLTKEQTKGTGATTIQIRRKHNTNRTTQRAAIPDRTAAPSGAASESPLPRSPPPPEPSMTAHGMEYPALFGQVGWARPAVPLPGFW